MDPPRLAAVAVGAVVGAGTRWAAFLVAGPRGADTALLAVNVAGSLLLGAVLAAPAGSATGSRRSRDVLAVGFCGALTTWSGLALQLAAATRDGDWAGAAAWLTAHLVLGIGAATLGWSVVRRRAAS
jgi:CrcB protein